MTLNYNLKGKERKSLVEGLEKITGKKAEYAGAPTFAYKIGKYTVNKEGGVEVKDSEALSLAGKLKDAGFGPIDLLDSFEEDPNESYNLVINLPKSLFKEGSLERVRQMVAAKETLIKHALLVDELPIEETDNTIDFPWFNDIRSDVQHDAYLHFVTALVDAANKQKYVSAKEKEVENEKYAFRCFLLKLGFIGDEYKAHRKELLKNLAGNSAFKAGKKSE